MRKLVAIIGIIMMVLSCNEKQKDTSVLKTNETSSKQKKRDLDELKYVLNDSFPLGDVRRYGVFPNKGIPNHPVTDKNVIQTAIDISEKLGIELYFPKGYYREGLIIKGKENVKIKFDEAEFSGPIYIIEDENKKGSKNIEFRGKVVTYTKFFTSYSSGIKIEKVHVKSNDTLSNYKKRSSGAEIYRGTEDLIIKELIIDDLGSGDEEFLTASAALQIHGWGANPKDIQINSVHIKSSDKHGAYITGDDIFIDELKIDAFGVGQQKYMTRMQDAAEGEEKQITGLWLNKCNNSILGDVFINTEKSKGKYALWLDSGGEINKPTAVEYVKLIGGDQKLPIYAEEDTNIVVKSVEK